MNENSIGFDQNPVAALVWRWYPVRRQVRAEGGVERTATQAECEGLERLAVWSALQIEDRLRDARAGRPNRWVEIVKIR